MLIVLGIIFFYFNHQRSHVYQPIAVQLCKSHSHDTLRVLLEAVGSRGGGGLLSVPALMRLMSHHLSVWELPEKKPSMQGHST